MEKILFIIGSALFKRDGLKFTARSSSFNRFLFKIFCKLNYYTFRDKSKLSKTISDIRNTLVNAVLKLNEANNCFIIDIRRGQWVDIQIIHPIKYCDIDLSVPLNRFSMSIWATFDQNSTSGQRQIKKFPEKFSFKKNIDNNTIVYYKNYGVDYDQLSEELVEILCTVFDYNEKTKIAIEEIIERPIPKDIPIVLKSLEIAKNGTSNT